MNSQVSNKNSLSFYELQQQTRPAPSLRLPMPAEASAASAPPATPKPPALLPEPTLTVHLTTDKAGYQGCTCTLSKAMVAQLPSLKTNTPLSCGTRALLVVPSQRGGKWYLDTRPKPGAGVYFTLNKSGGAAARIQPISKNHFMSTVPRFAEPVGGRPPLIAGSKNTLARRIKLKLGSELVDNPGYYRLLPLELSPEGHQEEHPQSW